LKIGCRDIQSGINQSAIDIHCNEANREGH
jgi:hypothetical protein